VITSTARRRRGLGIVPISDAAGNPVTPWSSTPAVITTPASGGSGCTTLDMLWGNLTGNYSGCVQDNQAMIQAVSDNAQMYYGGEVGAATEGAAEGQESGVASDVGNVVATQPTYLDELGSELGLGTYSGTPGSNSSWIWWVVAAVAAFGVIELAK
jgi:hypothetical protein